MRHQNTLLSVAAPLSAVSALLLGTAFPAAAKQAEPAPPPPVVEPALPPPAPEMAPAVDPTLAPAPAPADGPARTDHDSIVRRWGIEARRVATLQRTTGQDPACGMDCPVDLNAFGLRRWTDHDYAYSFGLAIAAGGGSTRTPGSTQTWDTYFGVGPTVGATFLLANFQHLAVGLSPQIDTAFFIPAASRPKTLIVNARGLIEGELHLGFWGLPQLSVALSSGLSGGFRYSSKGSKASAAEGTTATSWQLGTTGPQSLWGIVTNMYVRFYL